jgi:hypothetical protein
LEQHRPTKAAKANFQCKGELGERALRSSGYQIGPAIRDDNPTLDKNLSGNELTRVRLCSFGGEY